MILLIKREGFSILSLIRKTAKYVEYGMKNSHMGLIIHRCTLRKDYSGYPIPDKYDGFYNLEGETWPK